mmetsp:Transcript_98953/g.284300  ORF Transcript_98953/g.284300 Transcript_98953/m.284300 type:complete len:316 (+) Transcript_98953:1455-2402(+)
MLHRASFGLRHGSVDEVRRSHARVAILGAPLRDANTLGRVLRGPPSAADVAQTTKVLAEASPTARHRAICSPIQHVARSEGDLKVRMHGRHACVELLGTIDGDTAALRGLEACVPVAARVASTTELRTVPRLRAICQAGRTPIGNRGAIGRRQGRRIGNVHGRHAGVVVLGAKGNDALALGRVECRFPPTTDVALAAERRAETALVAARAEAIGTPMLHNLERSLVHQEGRVDGHDTRVVGQRTPSEDARADGRVHGGSEATAGVAQPAELIAFSGGLAASSPAIHSPIFGRHVGSSQHLDPGRVGAPPHGRDDG